MQRSTYDERVFVISMDDAALQSNLVKYLKLENSTPDVQQKVLESFKDLATEVTFAVIMESLNEDDAATYIAYSDEDATGEKAYQFAKDTIPDLEQTVSERLQEELRKIQIN